MLTSALFMKIGSHEFTLRYVRTIGFTSRATVEIPTGRLCKY